MNPRIAMALVIASALALGSVVLAASAARDGGADPVAGEVPDAFMGSLMPEGVRAPDFELVDQEGEPITMRQFRGRPVIVTFLYTNCEDSCPGQALTIKGTLAELGHDVPALAVAVDPPRDTPESARRFLSKFRLSGLIDFALGDRAELRPVWKGFGIQHQAPDAEHSARITLVDKRGFQRIGFPLSQATPERIAHDVRLLEREPG